MCRDFVELLKERSQGMLLEFSSVSNFDSIVFYCICYKLEAFLILGSTGVLVSSVCQLLMFDLSFSLDPKYFVRCPS